MAFIDWSDPEGMLDLLMEFIRDEMNESHGDADRQQFLTQLLTKVRAVNGVTITNASKMLRAIQDSADEEFQQDPVFFHITDLINEIERMK